MTNEIAVITRNVLVYTTRDNRMQNVATGAGLWGQLQNDLRINEIKFEGMKAVIGETQVTLESPKAVLPKEDFTLFLMPMKSKHGGELSYKECRARIKEIIRSASDKDEIKKFFSIGKKNYTNLTTNQLRSKLAKWDEQRGGSKILREEPPVEKTSTGETIFSESFRALSSIPTRNWQPGEIRELETIINDLRKLERQVMESISKRHEEEEKLKALKKKAMNIANNIEGLLNNF